MEIKVGKRSEDVILPALMREEEAMSQRMQAASRSWEGMATDSPLEPPEGTQTYWHLDFSQIRPTSDF